jgi:hypothetical protein
LTQHDVTPAAASDAAVPTASVGSRPASTVRRLLLLLALTACGGLRALPDHNAEYQRPPATRAEVDERIRGLVNLEGEYGFGDAVYSLMDNEVPLGAIAAADTVGIRSLVACLSDARRSHITLRGERAPVGLLCAEALSPTPYFQMGLQRRVFTASWPDMPPLTTDSLALGRMQSAWFQWLHEHQLTWPPLPGSSLACPSPDSIRAERFRDSMAADDNDRARRRIQETLSGFRYVTYVVDSEFVVLTDAHPITAQDSVRATALESLVPDDVASISVRKSGNEAWKWRACEGVPVVLITTNSKRWRPRASH